METRTQHRAFYFSGESFVDSSVKSLLGRKYDLAILSSSWDERCLAITTLLEVQFGTTLLLISSETDEFGLKSINDAIISEFSRKVSTQVFEVEGSMQKPTETWDQIYDALIRSKNISFPIKDVLIDLSAGCCFYTLGLMAMLLRLGLCQKIDFLYAECEYESKNVDHLAFTEGTWEKMLIPFLDGYTRPSDPCCSFISCGFEGLKTKKFIRSDEPDEIVLFLPSPGFSSDYQERTEREASELTKEFGLSESDQIRVEAGDAIAVWKSVEATRSLRAEGKRLSYICGGTKPHSLGMALDALAGREPEVYYIRPDNHLFVRTKVTGRFWMYRVEDLSQP